MARPSSATNVSVQITAAASQQAAFSLAEDYCNKKQARRAVPLPKPVRLPPSTA